MTVREIATWLDATVVGPDAAEIARPSKIEEAGPGSISFLANPKYARFLSTTQASAILVSPAVDISSLNRPTTAFLVVPDPYLAFLKVLKRLIPQVDPFGSGIHPSAIIAPSASIGAQVTIGPLTVIEEGVRIGDGTRIGAGVVIGKHAAIGPECTLHDGVIVYHSCILEARVAVHAGTVIGSDGFGYAPHTDGSYEKIPQLGIVHIHEDCNIGANCTIDRSTLGETVIHRGVKVDNLVQIAHNVSIGEHTVIAAQSGIAGSTKIGKHCRIAGQVAVSGHVEVADNTTLLGKTGVSKSITEEGRMWFGTPHQEHVRFARIEAVVRRLPELMKQIDAMQKAIDELSAQITK